MNEQFVTGDWVKYKPNVSLDPGNAEMCGMVVCTFDHAGFHVVEVDRLDRKKGTGPNGGWLVSQYALEHADTMTINQMQIAAHTHHGVSDQGHTHPMVDPYADYPERPWLGEMKSMCIDGKSVLHIFTDAGWKPVTPPRKLVESKKIAELEKLATTMDVGGGAGNNAYVLMIEETNAAGQGMGTFRVGDIVNVGSTKSVLDPSDQACQALLDQFFEKQEGPHVAGLSTEAVDWEAHKAFMRDL
jgi:hypothetical protein